MIPCLYRLPPPGYTECFKVQIVEGSTMLLEPRFRKVLPARASYDMRWDFWPRGGVWWIPEELRIVSLSLGDGRPPRPCQLVEKRLHHDQHQASQGIVERIRDHAQFVGSCRRLVIMGFLELYATRPRRGIPTATRRGHDVDQVHPCEQNSFRNWEFLGVI